MADVLSQSQIDALLKSMQNGDALQTEEADSVTMQPKEKKYRTYDFYSPRKFTKEKIKILNSVFENYAQNPDFPGKWYFPGNDGYYRF